MTGMFGSGKVERRVVTRVEQRLIQNIICCPVTLYFAKISSCVEFIAPSMAKLIKRYVMPSRPFLLSSLSPPPLWCLGECPSWENPMNIVIPTVTMKTTRYLCKANLRR